MVVKLDMSKAYYRIEWGFLEVVLLKMDFSRRWVELVISCINSNFYKTVTNGKVMGQVLPGRGIRYHIIYSLSMLKDFLQLSDNLR